MLTSAFAQGDSVSPEQIKHQPVKPVSITQTKKVGIAIDPLNKADIKALDDGMKPYEDFVKEYNRLFGLRDRIYKTLMGTKGVDPKDFAEQPRITADSINMVLRVEPPKK